MFHFSRKSKRTAAIAYTASHSEHIRSLCKTMHVYRCMIQDSCIRLGYSSSSLRNAQSPQPSLCEIAPQGSLQASDPTALLCDTAEWYGISVAWVMDGKEGCYSSSLAQIPSGSGFILFRTSILSQIGYSIESGKE
jgi:hypothetical protein